MLSRMRVAVVCASLVTAAGLADGKATKGHSSPIDGTWQAKGTVVVARHIQDVNVGEQFSRDWTIKTSCSGACETTLSYQVSGGHQVKVPLHGKGKTWSGSADHQVFACTDGGTATGSLAFKLHITGFVKHKKQRVATGMSGTGTQSGTGCAVIKEVAKLKVSRLGS